MQRANETLSPDSCGLHPRTSDSDSSDSDTDKALHSLPRCVPVSVIRSLLPWYSMRPRRGVFRNPLAPCREPLPGDRVSAFGCAWVFLVASGVGLNNPSCYALFLISGTTKA